MSSKSLEDLRFVAAADVYKAGQIAGKLQRTSTGAVEFRYSPDYEGAPVASTLPIDETIHWSGVGLPTFFVGLLPEGHRLTVLRRATKTSMDDELTLLLAVGADTPGDVQVVPAGQTPNPQDALAATGPSDLDFATLANVPDRHAIPGVQSKASATMLTTPLAGRGLRSILKLDPPNHPHLVLNEALHLEAARSLKIPVANAAVVRDRNRLPGLLIERFDRVNDGDRWQSLSMEDAAQAMDLLPAAKYSVDAEKVVASLVSLVRAKPVAVRNLYLQFVFAWLTGNGDLHAKNVSVLADKLGNFTVSPVYDIPCTLLYRDETMALPVAGRTNRIRARHWAEFADAIGLPQKAARSANRLAMKAAGFVDLSSLPFEGSPLNGAQRELRHRRAQLDG
ncbi:type II toxin-antitoxin system HipA family toxin [Arthrobacter roseus]|uniref:type II toxin-antitoxin system HipA family toxin n=1 Tax=Arthrobacter roseus TaxID=136274 RepID=UPI0019628929|nr:HipA domain-containing protein [Arthrobacter roseus]MBM7847723.1 serine/threonine-protein kinase HipA [Arthrobacter roseus]